MGMIRQAMARLGYEKRSDAADPSWGAIAPGIGYPGSLSARAHENLSTVLACTGATASALAYVPVLVYRIEGDARVEVMNHPVRRLWRDGATDNMTWPDFMEHLVASTLLTGNGLATIERDARGQLTGLTWVPWGMVTVQYLRSARLAYDVSDGRGGMRRFLQGEVLHLRDRTDDGLIGRSRLSRAADAVAGVVASNDFARSFLNVGAQPSGVISSDHPLTTEQYNSIRDSFTRKHVGTANAGRAMILDGGLKWTAMQVSPEDAELLESRKFGVEEICRLFQVPPPLVQDYSHNTFTNSETAGRWFAQFTLAAWARKIEAEFARTVLSSNVEMELDLSGFLRGDPQTRWANHKIAIDAGVLDTDEVRQVEGWNPRSQAAA